jgi:tetratricopeptide (TPR) repeat protein
MFSVLAPGAAWVRAGQQPAGQQAAPQWKDRAEYDLYVAITKETDPKKKLALLNQWTEKYPDTALKQARMDLYLGTYQQLGDAKEMFATAKSIIAEYPNDFQALYAVSSLTPALTPSPAPPEAIDTGEKAARGLLTQIPTVFAPDKKPATMPEANWKRLEAESQAVAHRMLGWAAMQKKDYATAEQELEQELKLNPADAEGFYWLGTVLIAEKNPDKNAAAMYYIARAACYSGPGAVAEAGRTKIHEFIQKLYTNFHGQDPAGFEALCNQAKAQPFPPPDFKILSSAEIAAGKQQQLMQTNPALAFWLNLKGALEAQDGQNYFDSGVKGALIPPEGQPALKGTVISQEPAKAPRTIVVALGNATTPDATLKIVSEDGTAVAMPRPAEPGTVIEFRGVATSFTKEPFMVNFDVERKNLSGWPAPPPPKKRAPIRRKK